MISPSGLYRRFSALNPTYHLRVQFFSQFPHVSVSASLTPPATFFISHSSENKLLAIETKVSQRVELGAKCQTLSFRR